MELNNIFVYLVSEFFKENLFSLVSILVLSGSITLLYTNGISKYTANIFDKVNDNKISEVWSLFIGLGVFYILAQIVKINITFLISSFGIDLSNGIFSNLIKILLGWSIAGIIIISIGIVAKEKSGLEITEKNPKITIFFHLVKDLILRCKFIISHDFFQEILNKLARAARKSFDYIIDFS